VLAYGFRPFFLLAGLFAALAMALWLADLAGGIVLPSALPAHIWHAHEMLFGFAAAAIAGFLLTAIPNWTGRLPLHGAALLTLVLLWLAGRIAVSFSGMIGLWTAAVIDLAFLAVLLAAVAREILAGKNWRNMPMLGALAALLVANALMHMDVLGLVDTAMAGWRLGISVVVLLIALIGGRIIPSFTRNWLARQSAASFPAPFGRLDRVALVVSVAALAAWIGFSGTAAAAALAALACVSNAARLARWEGHRTLRDPLVFVLHAGYAWLPVGFAGLALAQGTALLSESGAVHAFTAGAIGTMTLAVMTRATLGHTGRPLRADAGTTTVYALVTFAALARIAAAAWPSAPETLLWLAGGAWFAAFAGFTMVYGPMLLRPRIDGRPG
jgi:uncharacterized protein involved in response to NO